MTKQRREEILSKDILRIADVQELNNMSYQMAAALIRDIKRAMNPLFCKTGQIATSDYLDFFKERSKPAEREVVKKVNKSQQLFRAKDYVNV